MVKRYGATAFLVYPVGSTMRGDVEHVILEIPETDLPPTGEITTSEAHEVQRAWVEMVRGLRESGYTVAALTDLPQREAMERISAAGLSGQFRTILTREEAPPGALYPSNFRDLLAILDANPTDALFVGGSPSALRWADRLGIHTAKSGWHNAASKPRAGGLEIDHPSGVLENLQAMEDPESNEKDLETSEHSNAHILHASP